MAHNPYEQMMSMAFDDMLTEEEHAELTQHLEVCESCANLWEHMSLIDTLFIRPVEMTPSIDFKANVMNRIESYETGRRWYPFMVSLLVIVSIMAALWVAFPILLLSFGAERIVSAWPAVGSAIAFAMQSFTAASQWAVYGITEFSEWFTHLSSDPTTLAVVLSALVLASIWIGILEGVKATRSAMVSSGQNA